MASRELEITVSSAKDLKNVNWRYGPLRPYAVLWVDRSSKCSTRVDDNGDTSPVWNDTVVIPLPPGPVEDQTLYIDIVHVRSDSEEDTKPLIGSAKLKLRDVIEEAGYGERLLRSLHLKRPSGRPHGKLEVKVAVKDPAYRPADSYYAPPYGVQRQASREYAPPYSTAPPAYGNPYAPSPYYSTAPPSGYPYAAPPPPQEPYAAPPPPQAPYGQPGYGQPSYGQNEYAQAGKPKSKFGMGTGLAVGAVAGALGGLALAEGFDALEDKIADDAAEKVEDDIGYGDDDF
ncbi:hypothetical protein K2173_008643 [Erythroxylum novogranatense]|uniref:C2 domain-containing protein n=1 Tax=Erythroxylum novogranatense TaxID=1862640 RepID=A0AAV8SL33_9ROSI|nr:hypothetical protein K2173_008643 [Erythroxylum novogranatense]